MGKKYTREETKQMLNDLLKNNKNYQFDELYKSKLVNWKGTLKNENETYTNYISEELLVYVNESLKLNGSGKLNGFTKVTRSSSYSMHKGKAKINKDSKREEENIAKSMYNNSLSGHIYEEIGKILDYQVPLKNVSGDKVGKIDLISYNEKEKELFLLELKKPDSEETMLRAALEAYTYYSQVDIDKLIKDFNIPKDEKRKTPKIVVAPLVYKDRYAHMQYVSIYNNNLRTFMEKLNIKPYFIEKQVNNKGKVYKQDCKANDLAYIEQLLAKSNLADGLGRKGSKYWMGITTNTVMKKPLDRKMNDTVEWLSPLKDEEYREYKLSDSESINKLKPYIPNIESDKVKKIWNKNGQLWDGIGISKDKKTLYLVEAKAHTKEAISKCRASVKGNRDEIIKSLGETYNNMMKTSNQKLPEEWVNDYYQLANRLTYVKELNKVVDIKVKLILLNFTNDYTNISTTEDEFLKEYKKIQTKMFGAPNVLDIDPDVEIIYFSVIPS